jgi:Dioxygenase
MLQSLVLAILAVPTLATAPGGARCAFEAGQVALHEGRWKEAESLFGDALSGDYRPAESVYFGACAVAMQGERDRALDGLERALALDLDQPERAYADPLFESVRTTPRFRCLLRKNVHAWSLAIVPEGEPGDGLIVHGAVVAAADGKPVPAARLFVWQTGADGRCSRPKDDADNPRLFGYLEASRGGRFELQTVRPGGAPGTRAAQRIHYVVEADGYEKVEGEILFADDPNLDAATRAEALRRGFPIVDAVRGKGGVLNADATIALSRASG